MGAPTPLLRVPHGHAPTAVTFQRHENGFLSKQLTHDTGFHVYERPERAGKMVGHCLQLVSPFQDNPMHHIFGFGCGGEDPCNPAEGSGHKRGYPQANIRFRSDELLPYVAIVGDGKVSGFAGLVASRGHCGCQPGLEEKFDGKSDQQGEQKNSTACWAPERSPVKVEKESER